MKNITKAQNGYTLVELVLYIAVLSSIILSLGMFFTMAEDAKIKGQSISEVDEQGALAMVYITQAVRNASSITAPAAGATATQLTIASPTSSLNPTVINLNGTALQTKEATAAAIELTGSKVQVSSLSFTNLTRNGTTGTVRISFVISRTNTSSRNPYTYSKTFITTASLRR